MEIYSYLKLCCCSPGRQKSRDVMYQASGKFQLFRESHTAKNDVIDLQCNYMHSKIFHEEQACKQAECHLLFFKNLVFTY